MAKRKYEKPDDLWPVFEQYRDKTAKETIAVNAKKTRYKGVDGEKNEAVNVPKPLTLFGFMMFAGISNWHRFREIRAEEEDWIDCLDMIETIVKENQISGSLVGMYNPYLTARLNGLAEKQEVTNHEQVIKLSLGGDND